MIKVDAFILIVSILLQLYSIFDCGRVDQSQFPGLPKWAWLIVIIAFGGLGGLLWILVGKKRTGGNSGGRRKKPRIIPPDDDPDFLRKL
jgi:hypothetical protein